MTTDYTKMTTYSPRRTAAKNKANLVTWWDLYERAAKARYGEDICVIKTQFYKKKVADIYKEFELSVVDKDTEPREATRTIVDVNMKEYRNNGKESQDETIVKTSKSTTTTEASRYSFSTTKGVEFGVGGNLGAQVMGLSIAGVSGGIDARYKKSKYKTEGTEHSNEEGFRISYEQEEKITVPPGKYAKVKITSYSMKYEMNYTLKLSAEKNASLPVLYRTCCQRCFFGVCSSNGVVQVCDMISTLPNYVREDEDEMTSFTQSGTLSWIGEGCKVEKEVETLLTEI